MKKFSDFIEIDGAGFAKPDYYEEEVLKVLRQVNNTAVGMLVLHEVRKTGFKLTIKPAQKLVAANANPQNSHPWKMKNGDFCAVSSSSSLEYLPGDYFPHTGKFIQIEPFFGPDDVLVHELLHKARMMGGTMCKTPTNDAYDDMEEFFAILITNIYLSEIGKDHRLRAGHSVLIEQLKMSSYDFFIKYDQRMSILQREMRTFTDFISGIECKFNPLRDSFNFSKEIRDRPPLLGSLMPAI